MTDFTLKLSLADVAEYADDDCPMGMDGLAYVYDKKHLRISEALAHAWTPQDVFNETEAARDRWL